MRQRRTGDEALRAEEQLLFAVALAERAQTELYVLKAALRWSLAKLRRLRVSLTRAGFVQHHQSSLVTRPEAFHELLRVHGYADTAGLLAGFEQEVHHFERRTAEAEERFRRHEALLDRRVEDLRVLVTTGLRAAA